MKLAMGMASSSLLTAADSPSLLLRGEGRDEWANLSFWSRRTGLESFKLCARQNVKWPPDPLLQRRRGNEPMQAELASRLTYASGATESEKGSCP